MEAHHYENQNCHIRAHQPHVSTNTIALNEYPRACLHFENGDKNEINGSQTRKIAQIISGY
ncbi:MAG TPA: hypothetical protein DF294_06195 [Psychrobacter sp.]|nr:hypothetical protein [Psychrobacter sp.]